MRERALRHMMVVVFAVGSILLLLGLAVTTLLFPRSLRELRGMRDSEALRRWKSAPIERTSAIRASFRHGSTITDRGDADLAVAFSEHVDRVVAVTKRLSWRVCVPLMPGLIVMVGGLPGVAWAVAAGLIVLWLAFRPFAVRSQTRRRRSIDLTKRQHVQ